jgi:hypothetical protein
LLIILRYIPVTTALPDQDAFPDISFKLFSKLVTKQFSSEVTLATVLTVVFTLTNNSDLLNLHARQQHPQVHGETRQTLSGWIKSLARALQCKLSDDAESLLKDTEDDLTPDQRTTAIAAKLDSISKVLGLDPFDQNGELVQILNPISEQAIEPAYIICPKSMTCETRDCHSRGLLQQTRARDVPKVVLIKGTRIHEDVSLLAGECTGCNTLYYPDHETTRVRDGVGGLVHENTLYSNDAKFLKIGSNVWVDRAFSTAVLNGVYSFHASTAAYAEFWNESYWAPNTTSLKKMTRRLIWQAFIQESVRMIAAESGGPLEYPPRLAIGQVTEHAFKHLGNNGIISGAINHSCSECTHPYKRTADRMTGEDPAAVVGVDEGRDVPLPQNIEDAAAAHVEIAAARQRALQHAEQGYQPDELMDIDDPSSIVKMAVLDGIVMGHTHCAFEDCTEDLVNARNGVFCDEHEALHRGLCRIRGCTNAKVTGSQACEEHQENWYAHVVRYGRQSILGICRMLRRTEEERLEWLPDTARQVQPHDEPAPARRRGNYFIAPRFYCVETICAPCGVVIAWTKFARAESPTNILNFLQTIYPTEYSRPDYICIDKACLVLRTAITNGSWNMWQNTTRFIVDSYHYINHRTTDYLCRKWCNPAPINGDAPNLVVVVQDKNGRDHYKRAFNTQACEQLNAWLGGYQTILNKMTANNFNWFLHTMLFLHTKHVLKKQLEKKAKDERKERETQEMSDEDTEDEALDGEIGINIDRECE